MTGEQLSVLKVNTGYMNYKAKISQKSYLEDDPNFKCKLYTKQDSYSGCLEQEFLNQLSPYLKCSPPWLVGDENMWCNETLHLDEEVVKSYRYVLGNILDSQADIGNCFQPCKSLHFDVRLDIFDHREDSDRYGLYIQFEDTVETTTLNLAITTTTLLTRIGGIIGVGKELLWVFIFFCGAGNAFFSFIYGLFTSFWCKST